MTEAAPIFELEFAEPHIGAPCPCCGGLTVRGTGFVTVEDDAYAVYYVTYANNHPEGELALIVSIGDWSEDADEGTREAFYCRLRPADGSYQLMLDDADQSPWANESLLGRKLSREQARAHPLKTTVFSLTDEIGSNDPRVVGYFARAACGDTSVPLEHNFALPDDLWALPQEDRDGRIESGRNFARLDNSRHFIRVLLRFDVEHYEDWSVGLWVEVAREVYDEVYAAWDDTVRYSATRFTGALANDLNPFDLPGAAGVVVTVHVADPQQPPHILESQDAALEQMRKKKWDRSSFEAHAVARGLL